MTRLTPSPSPEGEGSKKELPPDWRTVTLGEVAENIQYGYTESSSKVKNGPKFLRITDIQENKVNWADVPYCKITDEKKKGYLLKKGDLLFARTGATVGKSFLIRGEIPEAVFASYLIRVRMKEGFDESYISAFFHSPLYWRQITEGQVGIGQPNVNGTKLGQLILPLPPLATQQAIVAEIEELFSELDKGIESIKLAQQQLKTYRQSVLKAAFEGRLTDIIRQGFKPLPNETVNERDGELPAGWKWVTLKDICTFSQGIQVDVELQSEIQKKNQVRFLRIIDFTQGDEPPRYIDNPGERYFLKADEIAMVRYGTVGFVCTGKEGVIANNLFKITPVKDVLKKYLIYFFHSALFTANLKTKGATMQALSFNLINPIRFPLPPLAEQQAIVAAIESRLSVADQLEATLAQSLQQAEALRQSVLKQAFEGRLV